MPAAPRALKCCSRERDPACPESWQQLGNTPLCRETPYGRGNTPPGKEIPSTAAASRLGRAMPEQGTHGGPSSTQSRAPAQRCPEGEEGMEKEFPSTCWRNCVHQRGKHGLGGYRGVFGGPCCGVGPAGGRDAPGQPRTPRGGVPRAPCCCPASFALTQAHDKTLSRHFHKL